MPAADGSDAPAAVGRSKKPSGVMTPDATSMPPTSARSETVASLTAGAAGAAAVNAALATYSAQPREMLSASIVGGAPVTAIAPPGTSTPRLSASGATCAIATGPYAVATGGAGSSGSGASAQYASTVRTARYLSPSLE